ncbi:MULTISPECIES: hypothetical protein [unclassified Delftia]|uniref:hypothetical protein n=1 Tax=unclassified Delftia TaxID=2613839 RepID=UPI000646AF14|nr:MULTISPECIES: hypothetical protein [unclassified Delftia]MDC2857287.1 hypothetical protein [Delftia sp. DT-2]
MILDYLDFDYSEDDEGTGCWDAMASVPAARVPALAAEVEQLLAWAHRRFRGRRGPIEEGGDWDYELQAQDDGGQPLAWRFDAATARLQSVAAGDGRTTVNLSISGSAAFGEALRQAFELQD